MSTFIMQRIYAGCKRESSTQVRAKQTSIAGMQGRLYTLKRLVINVPEMPSRNYQSAPAAVHQSKTRKNMRGKREKERICY